MSSQAAASKAASAAGSSQEPSTATAASSISRRAGQSSDGSTITTSTTGTGTSQPIHSNEIKELREALSDMQLEKGRLLTEIRSSDRQNVELKLLVSKKMKSLPAGAITSVGSVTSADADVCSKFGRRMPVFYTPNITVETFGIRKPDFDYLSSQRYAGDNFLLGQVADIYECISAPYHDRIFHDRGFAKLFTDSASSQLSNSLLRLRSKAGEIFGVPQRLFAAQTEIDRSSNEILRSLSGAYRDTEGAIIYPQFPPVFYPAGAVDDESLLFMGEHLFTIAVVVICGASYVDGRKPTYRSNNTFIPSWPKEDICKRFHATPGFIAFIAMITKFMLSNDTEFPNSGEGATTLIHYFNMHSDITELLICGLEDKDPSIQALFDAYNRRVFPSSLRGIAASSRSQSGHNVADKRPDPVANQQPRVDARATLAKMAEARARKGLSDAHPASPSNSTSGDKIIDLDPLDPPFSTEYREDNVNIENSPHAPLSPHAPGEQTEIASLTSTSSNSVLARRRRIPIAAARPVISATHLIASDSDDSNVAAVEHATGTNRQLVHRGDHGHPTAETVPVNEPFAAPGVKTKAVPKPRTQPKRTSQRSKPVV